MNTINKLAASAALLLSLCMQASAQDVVTIGFSAPLTGPFAQNGKHMVAGAKYYMAEHGDTVAGKKIQLLIRDDTGVPDQAKRIAQEFVVNQKVPILAGFNVTPVALAVAPISAEAKVPQIVTAAATSVITERSPYIVRTYFTLPQISVPLAAWAAENGIKKVVTIVSDYAPGYDAEKYFADELKAKGGTVVESIRVPLQNPDFAPFLQRARDTKPDALFVFVPGNQTGSFARQYTERGLDKSGIKLIGPGLTDDDALNQMGDSMIGVITSNHYSAAHPSEKNKAFVAGYAKANPGMRANDVAVAAYDGMHLIYEALKKTGGNTNGDALIAAMKGIQWERARGPVSIDPETRDIIQNVYIRRVEKKDGELHNIEFATIPAVKDPAKVKK